MPHPLLTPRSLLTLASTVALAGCCYLGHHAPPPQPVYASIKTSSLSLHEKAAGYEARLRDHHRTPEGLVDYRRPKAGRPPELPRYGRHADGPFFTGIALATFSLKYAATRDPEVLADVSHALAGLEMLEKVTGKPGLLARYFSRDPAPFDPALMHPEHGRRAAPPLDDYVYRGDVSRDQYAGVSYGLGACLAHVDDLAIRARARSLARRIVEALERDGERIIDTDGEPTRFGDLEVYYGPVRIALHAAICLGLATCAAADGGDDGYLRALHQRNFPAAVADGWFNVSVLTIRNHVNDNMAFLTLYPLLQLERDPQRLALYRRGLEGAFEDVSHELNALFNLVYASSGGQHAEPAVRDAVTTLRQFPEEKVYLPVDWTHRKDLGRRFFNSRKCVPRAAAPLPVNLRPLRTMAWVSDPDVLYGNISARGELWLNGLDYLEAYWMARAHGLVTPED